MFEAFGPYGYLLTGALIVGVVGLILSVVDERWRSHRAGRVTTMVKLTATIEQGADGTFIAVAVIGHDTIIGDGDTREEAIADLRKGAKTLFEYRKSKGESFPQPLTELVSVEVAL